MALEGVDKTLFQLKDKETNDDIEYDAQLLEKEKELSEDEPVRHQPMTTRKEVLSWWLFDCANSPQMGVGLAFVFPVFLTLMATRYSCLNNTPYGCDWNDDAINSDYTLRVSLGGWNLKPESYASSMISISSIFQAVSYILFSALADYGMYKIYLFRITAICAQIMFMSWILFTTEDVWLFAGIWGAASTIPFGLTLIFYNAYLLELVENHWRIRRLERTAAAHKHDAITLRGQKKKLMVTLQDDISEWGFACGYCGSIVVTIITVVLLFVTDDTNTGIIQDIGTNNKELNALETMDQWKYEYNIDSQTYYDELNVLPVIDANIWYSVITLYEDSNVIDTFSLINGIQLIYHFKEERMNGAIFGNNESINDIIITDHSNSTLEIGSNGDIFDNGSINDTITTDHSNSTLEIRSYHGILGDIGDVKVLNVYLNDVGLVNAVQFNSDGDIYGITENTQLIENKYEDFYLGGYEVTLSMLNIEFHDDTQLKTFNISDMNIISGFKSIAFVATDGRYGSLIGFQLSYFVVGLWFLIFSIPAFMYLKKRVRPPIPSDSSAWTISVKSYWKTAKKATSYPDLFRYLITWFLFSDALMTTSNAGILFGQVELGMTAIQLVLLLIEVEVFAVIGAFFFVWFQKKMQWNAKQMLLLQLSIMTLLPLYAVFGIIEGSPFGLVHIWEMYLFVGIYGFHQGSIQALSRSLFGHLVPSGEEAQFFGLYEITDKGSAWLGPMMMAVVSNISSMRWGLIYVLGFYVFAIPLLYFGVDYERGHQQAKVYVTKKDEEDPKAKDAKEVNKGKLA